MRSHMIFCIWAASQPLQNIHPQVLLSTLPSMRCLPKAERRLCPDSNELTISCLICLFSHILRGLCIQLESLGVPIQVLALKALLFWLKNAPLYQDIWSCSHDRDDILTWPSPKKNYSDIIRHSLLSSIFPAYGLCIHLISYRDLNSM